MNYRLILMVTPEDNPELGLPDMVSTRRGMTHPMPTFLDEERSLLLELRAAMRAIETYIERWKKGEIGDPPLQP